MLLSELCADYIQTNPNVSSEGTARLFRLSVQHFDSFLERAALVEDLTDAKITAYMRHRKKLGRMPATITNETKKLLAIWRWAAAPPRLMLPPPGIRLASQKPATPHAYTRAELRRMFRAAQASDKTIGNVPVSIYYPALLAVVFDSGERINAVLQTKRRDFDLTERSVTFRRRKNESQVLTKRLRRSTARALKRLFISHSQENPFGYVHFSTVYYHLGIIQEAAGLPSDRRKFHAVRKSHASYVHVEGGDSTASLGHSSDSITRAVYHDPRITQRWHPIDYLFDPLGWWERLLGWLGI